MKNIIEPSQNVDYDDVFESICNDAQRRHFEDDRVWKIWQAGLAAQHSVQRIGFWAWLSGVMFGAATTLAVIATIIANR